MTARGAVQLQLVAEPVEALKLTDRIILGWKMRPCFICRQRGMCDHRELDVALAQIAAEDDRQVLHRQALTTTTGRVKR